MFGSYVAPHVLILGLGESGQSMVHWCLQHGARVRWADTRVAPPHLAERQTQFPQAEFVVGRCDVSLLEGVQILGLSPGLSPYHEPLRSLYAEAHARGIAVWSEIEFFAHALAHLRQTRGYAPRCVGITGTNGKTTVTALCAFLAHQAGQRATAAGNISPAVLDALDDALRREALPDLWALELSSFQLETTHSLILDAAVVLNLTEDHLDWHPSMAQYAEAKGRIYQHATVKLANRDDALTQRLAGEHALTYGLDAPTQANDWGIVDDGGLRWLVYAEGESEPIKKKRHSTGDAAEPVRVTRLMPADALRLRGTHNIANTLAALALVTHAGVPLAKALYGLREFRGLPHRVQWVRQIQGVDYFDDSKGTNVGATAAALQGLRRRVVLIAGGDGKGQDFQPLAAPIAEFARAVLLMGRDAPHLQQAWQSCGVPLEICTTLEAAVQRAAALAQVGDAVLLSPACASFDMFRNYEHRAQVFVDAVQALAVEVGEVV